MQSSRRGRPTVWGAFQSEGFAVAGTGANLLSGTIGDRASFTFRDISLTDPTSMTGRLSKKERSELVAAKYHARQ